MGRNFWIGVSIFIALMVVFSVVVINVAATGETTTVVLPVKKKQVFELESMNANSCIDKMDNNLDVTIPGLLCTTPTANGKSLIVEYDMVKIFISDIKNKANEAGCKVIQVREYKKSDKPKIKRMIMKCGAGKCGASMMQEAE